MTGMAHELLKAPAAKTASRAGFARALIACAACLFLLSILPIQAQPHLPALKEHEVRALYLFNFTKYLEWPSSSTNASDKPFIFGFLDECPVQSDLRRVVETRTVGNRPVKIQVFTNVADLAACQVVYVRPEDMNRWNRIREVLGNRPVLTVGEQNGFLNQGGMIEFVRRDINIRFRVNAPVLRQSGLTVSSKLLAIAETWEPPKKE
jgi:hypothetical protein